MDIYFVGENEGNKIEKVSLITFIDEPSKGIARTYIELYLRGNQEFSIFFNSAPKIEIKNNFFSDVESCQTIIEGYEKVGDQLDFQQLVDKKLIRFSPSHFKWFQIDSKEYKDRFGYKFQIIAPSYKDRYYAMWFQVYHEIGKEISGKLEENIEVVYEAKNVSINSFSSRIVLPSDYQSNHNTRLEIYGSNNFEPRSIENLLSSFFSKDFNQPIFPEWKNLILGKTYIQSRNSFVLEGKAVYKFQTFSLKLKDTTQTKSYFIGLLFAISIGFLANSVFAVFDSPTLLKYKPFFGILLGTGSLIFSIFFAYCGWKYLFKSTV